VMVKCICKRSPDLPKRDTEHDAHQCIILSKHSTIAIEAIHLEDHSIPFALYGPQREAEEQESMEDPCGGRL
jgi:hypothetical protein